MTSLNFTQKLSGLLATSVVVLGVSVLTNAQVQTQSTTSQGKPTVETKVQRGEVVYVSGNDVVVKTEDGQIKNYPNVPDSVKINVDGQQLTVHDLKPGMKLERTITTTTTPRTVKTVQSVTGTVWQVMPPTSVILTLEDGTNQQFKIPKGQKFTVNGAETDAFGLKKGMKISATKIVEAPQTEVAEQRTVTGEMPPSTEAMAGPVLIQSEPKQPTETAQAAAAAPGSTQQQLPQTASSLPLLAALGTFAMLAGLAIAAAGKR